MASSYFPSASQQAYYDYERDRIRNGAGGFGLGGMLGGMAALGQARTESKLVHAVASAEEAIKSKPDSVHQKLQRETDNWLKDINVDGYL